MARTQSANYDTVRQGILDRATALFAAQGYMRSSIGDLAAASGLSRGALYHYFASKEAILFAILEVHVRRLVGIIAATAAAEADPERRLRRMIGAIVDYNATSYDEQRVLLNDLKFLDPREQEAVKALERRIVDAFAATLEALDAHGRMDGGMRKVYAMCLLGMINYSYTWYHPSGPVAPATLAAVVGDTFLDGFLAGRVPAVPGAGGA